MPVPNQAANRQPIICPICQKSFANSDNKKKHTLLVHENAGRFKCGHCGKTFQSETKLKAHENIHTGERPFGCNDCGKRFNTKGKEHELYVHEEKKFKCPQCEMAFAIEQDLKRHLVTHSTEKPFQCDKCPKRFPSKYLLKSHQVRVHQEKKFKCETCEKDFAKNSELKAHLATHSEEKPFGCKDCSKRFTTKSYLKKHKLDNHAEKKFICGKCKKGFGREKSLKLHLVVHSEKKFKCGPCGRNFARKDYLRRHIQKKHREDREEVDEQPGESNGSGGAKYSLRTRNKQANYREGPDLEESDESETDMESGGEEAAQPERDGERRMIKIENCLLEDEQGSEPDDRMESTIKRVKREPKDAEGSRSSDESGNEDSDEFQESDEETDRDESVEHDLDDRMEHDLDDLMEGCSKRIKIEPEEIELAPIEPTDFEAYDFNELAAANMKRMKMESKAVSGQVDQE